MTAPSSRTQMPLAMPHEYAVTESSLLRRLRRHSVCRQSVKAAEEAFAREYTHRYVACAKLPYSQTANKHANRIHCISLLNILASVQHRQLLRSDAVRIFSRCSVGMSAERCCRSCCIGFEVEESSKSKFVHEQKCTIMILVNKYLQNYIWALECIHLVKNATKSIRIVPTQPTFSSNFTDWHILLSSDWNGFPTKWLCANHSSKGVDYYVSICTSARSYYTLPYDRK